uniref:Transmembrane protein 88 a n=2 Tax=Sphaeramia orbicularis TaxID=375764 RepID=A0A673B5E5_9TELE
MLYFRLSKMSLSRSGTLEKTISEHGHSEHRSPSRAGSGVVVPPPYSLGGSEAADTPLELRGSLDCWACSVLVTAQNMVIALINSILASVVFGIILTPALAMILFGFLCHSTVRPHGTSLYCSDILKDAGCVALLVVGFLLLTPLLVLALAAYCRLARHLQLGMCFIPYSRAVYKNLPASRRRGGGCCSQQGPSEREGKGSVWV